MQDVVPRKFVFLSYSYQDREIATQLASALRIAGIDVWLDMDIQVGDRWNEIIATTLQRAQVILVLVTPASVESKWVQAEWMTALTSSKRVIPVVAGGRFDLLKGPLAHLQGAHFDPADAASINNLASNLHRLLNQIPLTESAGLVSAIDDARLSETQLARIVEMTVRQVVQEFDQKRRPTPETSLRRDSSGSKSVFIVASFAPDMDPTVEAIKAAASGVGLDARRVKDVPGDYRITDQILRMIEDCLFVVADLTHERPNVYFELGYARGLDKRVVTIMRDSSTPHFDVQDWTYIKYSDSRPLEKELRDRFLYELGVVE